MAPTQFPLEGSGPPQASEKGFPPEPPIPIAHCPCSKGICILSFGGGRRKADARPTRKMLAGWWRLLRQGAVRFLKLRCRSFLSELGRGQRKHEKKRGGREVIGGCAGGKKNTHRRARRTVGEVGLARGWRAHRPFLSPCFTPASAPESQRDAAPKPQAD
ncbi:hypothetical protein TraAM80_09875 [Trypanosoma rangeli]|uniref:Uncharacterized protein n=1 Tax=Trypanosoma rangeli TaxID=5698 RepID=A0A422MSV3_TRYRA|nr:uncharacterized protein TraAM80_09875 [Trypanosoma rangeli]RNE96281.1 hypothetical protein TraAM80_09875 [Trypanosoma rangeli]|eukprot:RNE96281.1 hypothetical protein TraAM80_09875 [Trypanosoma rangeli]